MSKVYVVIRGEHIVGVCSSSELADELKEKLEISDNIYDPIYNICEDYMYCDDIIRINEVNFYTKHTELNGIN